MESTAAAAAAASTTAINNAVSNIVQSTANNEPPANRRHNQHNNQQQNGRNHHHHHQHHQNQLNKANRAAAAATRNQNNQNYQNVNESSESSSLSQADTIVPTETTSPAATATTTSMNANQQKTNSAGSSGGSSSKKQKQQKQRSPYVNNNNNTHNKSNRNNSIDANLISSTIISASSLTQNKSGSKKTNLNHLLNFTYESYRESNENYYEYERLTKQFWSMKLAKNSYFSKEQFLQANCQFVVKSTGDYSVHLADPDLLVDWEKIEEIHIGSHESITCPICLYAPQAGKMTKCGHVYCWSCILHYLALSDKAWRKCPICFESIYKNDLKSFRMIDQANEFKVGDEISLNLMFKFKNKYNTVIMPMSVHEQFLSDAAAAGDEQSESSSSSNISFNMLNKSAYKSCQQYIKLHPKSDQEIYESVIKRERDELNRQLEAEKHQPEVCFVNEALQLLDEREKSLKIKLNSTTTTNTNNELTEKQQIVASAAAAETGTNKNNCNHSDEFSYFYQSTDGQRIYVNALNSKCLISEYNSFANCPLVIYGQIVACQNYFMTEENRKRYKYLSHLPLHSEFRVVELDLQEPLVSRRTLDQFKDEIEERKLMRTRKEIKEKRMADKIAAASQTAEPSYYVRSAAEEIGGINFNSQTLPLAAVVDYYSNEFPEASTSPTLSSGVSGGCESTNSTSTSSSANISSQKAAAAAAASVSFAQMLKHKNHSNSHSNKSSSTATMMANDFDLWPSLDSTSTSQAAAASANGNSSAASLLNNLNQVNSTQLTSGWLTMVKHQETTTSGRTRRYQEAPTAWGVHQNSKQDPLISTLVEQQQQQSDDEDDSMPAPLYQQSFFSAIDASLKSLESRKNATSSNLFDEAADENSEEQQPQVQQNNSKQASKKKKKTKQLLFSTSLNMGI